MLSEHNPRNLREKYQTWLGKKVVVGLSDFHYLCGTWEAVEGYDAIFNIGGRRLAKRLDTIATVEEAPAALAEYFK